MAGREPRRCGVSTSQPARGSRPRDEVLSLAGAGISLELVRQAGQREDRVARRRSSAGALGAEHSGVNPECSGYRDARLVAGRRGTGCAVTRTGDAHVDSASHPARLGACDPRARQGSRLSRRTAGRSIAGVFRFEERPADAGADGQGDHLRQRRREQDPRWPPSGEHRPRRPGSRGRPEVQRVHALQPVPPGDRRRASRGSNRGRRLPGAGHCCGCSCPESCASTSAETGPDSADGYSAI